MPSESPTDGDAPTEARWPWFALAVALLWATLVRVPLVLNAPIHLDSDLAVDGIVLQEALRGHWRWHYPGTPHIGIPPLFLSLPQAAVFGASPATLVSGGVVAWLLLIVGTFLAARSAFGMRVAGLSTVPLAFSSTGAIWLSGRITGGHLLTAAWFAGAIGILAWSLKEMKWGRALVLGLWWGFGLYLDRMTVLGIAGMGIAWLWALFSGGQATRSRRIAIVAACGLGFVLGARPLAIGQARDPYDAYNEQFRTIFHPRNPRGSLVAGLRSPRRWLIAADHAKLLVLECVPRLLVGHRLPHLESDPPPQSLGVESDPVPSNRGPDPVGLVLSGLVLPMLLLAASALGRTVLRGASTPGRAAALALCVTSVNVAIGFMINYHIYNSDNYRYLVLWLPAWGMGLGLALDRMSRLDGGGVAAAAILVVALATLTTWDAARWYGRFGWLEGWTPTRANVEDPALACLEHHPEIGTLYGDYWEVYRLMFLTGGRVVGVPFPYYPDRFQVGSGELIKNRFGYLIWRTGRPRTEFHLRARHDGERICDGDGVSIWTLPPEPGRGE